MSKLRSGIKILKEIEGYGPSIQDCGRFDAVLKYYRNRGDPLEFQTMLQEPIPYIEEIEGKSVISWHPPKMHLSNISFERNSWLARQGDLIPGIYYSILGMKRMGYRNVSIPPHLFARSVSPSLGLDSDSIVKMEIFLIAIRDVGSDKKDLNKPL